MELKKLMSSRAVLFAGGFVVVLVIVLIARGAFDPSRPIQSTLQGSAEIGSQAVRTFTGGGDFGVTPDTPGYENYGKLRDGCPVRDCIPSIDDPKFETAGEASLWLEPEDVVFALNHNGVERAYPQRILNWHEIVNDDVGGDPIAVTFCPLCGSAIAFDRRVDGQVLDFGVSGKLFNSDLVMYDRQTETLWEQITGMGIVGQKFESVLKPISMDTLRWQEWKEAHPGTMVLSRETGFVRDYDRYPYNNYEQDAGVYFPVTGGVDDTIHPKRVVYGVGVNGEFKAYPEDELSERGSVVDVLGGVTLNLVYDNGEISVTNADSGEEIVPARMFWFAWKAFRPDTELFE